MPWKQKPFGWGKAIAGESLFPSAQEATATILDQVTAAIRQDSSISEVVFRLEHPEPPSIELAIHLMLEQVGRKLKFTCLSNGRNSPSVSPSKARKPLWKFARGKAKVAVGMPGGEYLKACSEIAATATDCFDSWNRSTKYASSHSIADVESCLAVMVHPSQIEANFSAVDWVRKVQLAAAQLAVSVEQKNEIPVSDSLVADVVSGPIDWSVEAAMVALAQRANEESAFIPCVKEIVQDVMLRIPQEGTWSCREVAQNVLRFLELTESDASTTTEPSSSNQ